ncbi:hypothetical protein C0993_012562 [Termitomyces sp. T159_Od127]|nr:hypothetical protein C0993_012562 [Termitomyces sp. T159_Od127]
MPHSDHVDIRNFVENLRTLLVFDLDDVTEETVPRAHKSFFDFIIGDHIPKRFCVDIQTSNAELALLCLHHLTLAYPDVHTTHYASKESDLKILSPAARYSLRFALSHMPHQGNSAFGVLSDHPEVVESSQLDGLLHHSTHPNCAGPLSFSIPSNHNFVRTSLDKKDLLWNPEDGSITSDISLSYSLPILFSPGGSGIFIWSHDGIQCMQEDSYELSNKLSSDDLIPIIEPSNWLGQSLVYSFDGTKMAYSTDQEKIIFYDISLNVVASKIPNRHQAEIEHLCLSQNCSYIASSSWRDGVVHIWDIDKKRYINQSSSIRHEHHVVCMAFAPDEKMLISCDDQHAYVWEIPTCNRSPHSFKFNPGGNRSVAFSPDSQTILAGSKEGYVSLWSPHTGEQLGEPWNVPTPFFGNKAVLQVAFRSCGKIALARCDSNVSVWNVPDATALVNINLRGQPAEAVFSPDGSRLVYADRLDLNVINLAPWFSKWEPPRICHYR